MQTEDKKDLSKRKYRPLSWLADVADKHLFVSCNDPIKGHHWSSNTDLIELMRKSPQKGPRPGAAQKLPLSQKQIHDFHKHHPLAALQDERLLSL